MLILIKENLMVGTHTRGGLKTCLHKMIQKASWEETFWRHQTTAKQKDNLPYIRHLVDKCVNELCLMIRPNDTCYEAMKRESVSVLRSALQHRTSSITHIKLSFSEAQVQSMNIQ
jgi:hypothetical protein